MLLTDIFGRNFMDDFFEDFAASSFYRPNRLGSVPAMKADVQELDHAYQIDLDLPGFCKEDLHAELKDGYLTIKAGTPAIIREASMWATMSPRKMCMLLLKTAF